MDVSLAAQDIAEKQVHKFHMYNTFFGDNTSIILVDLGAYTSLTKGEAIGYTASCKAVNTTEKMPSDDIDPEALPTIDPELLF